MKMPKPDATPFQMFTDALTDELIAMPDAEVLDGLDPDAVQANGLRLLADAKAKVGKQRLIAAREAIKAKSEVAAKPVISATVSEARAYLLAASNDPQFTLAAREINELSDEDVLRLFSQAMQLASLTGKDNAEDK